MKLKLTLLVFISLLSSQLFSQRISPVDQIVVVVNTNVILKSDVDRGLAEFLQMQNQDFSEELWFEVLESLVDNFVLVEKARLDSVIVTDDEVNRMMDQRIRALVERAGSEEAVERAFAKSIVQLKAEYRDEFRKDILAEQVREKRRSKIRITRPEVEKFFNAIPRDSLPFIPETVQLAQIVSIPPPKKDAENRAYALASTIRDSIVNFEMIFEEMARRFGEDATAQNGGYLPLMPISDLVSEFSAAAAALEPGGISEVVRTVFGFHIIRLNRRVGDQIETNHILIRIGDSELDDEFSINKLNSLRDSIIAGQISFFNAARQKSDDKITATSGGRLINPQTGERRLPLDQLDPSLYRVVLMLDNVGDISDPRLYNSESGQRAYRIIILLNRVPEHRANLDQDFDIIRQIALQQKQYLALSEWIRGLRDEIHVEYLIQSPYISKK